MHVRHEFIFLLKLFPRKYISKESSGFLKDNNFPIQGIIVEKYIGLAQSLPFRSEIKQIEGKQVARNGQIPGMIDNPKLNKLI